MINSSFFFMDKSSDKKYITLCIEHRLDFRYNENIT
jgi:hypothetical protein